MTYPAHNLIILVHQTYNPSLQDIQLLLLSVGYGCLRSGTECVVKRNAYACSAYKVSFKY